MYKCKILIILTDIYIYIITYLYTRKYKTVNVGLYNRCKPGYIPNSTEMTL